jgi:hypothetical protein
MWSIWSLLAAVVVVRVVVARVVYLQVFLALLPTHSFGLLWVQVAQEFSTAMDWSVIILFCLQRLLVQLQEILWHLAVGLKALRHLLVLAMVVEMVVELGMLAALLHLVKVILVVLLLQLH